MIYKKFSVQVVLLTVLMGLSVFLFLWSMKVEHLQFSVYGFAFLSLFFLVIIIRLTLKNNYKIYRFLENYVVNEGAPKFNSGFKDSSFLKIEKQLNRIAELYGEVKTEKEAEHIFLQQLIDELQVGVLVYNEKGKIGLKNRFFSDLFGIHVLSDIHLLKKDYTEIFEMLELRIDKSPKVFRLIKDQQRLVLSVSIHRFRIKNETFHLALLQDVTHEISQEEVESWQKLIKILRHEIINSLTPIATLSSTLIDNFDEVGHKKSFKGEHAKLIDANYKGLKAIEKRSEGLMEFIKAYKELSATLKPEIEEVTPQLFFENLRSLVKTDLEQKGIDFEINLPNKPKSLFIDEKQMTQVMLNLLKNAVEALEKTDNPQVTINYNSDENQNVIEVIDNGQGISKDILDHIFIPFFSTKPNGSGVGLSLCKQIMQLHKGSINVMKREGKTVVRLKC